MHSKGVDKSGPGNRTCISLEFVARFRLVEVSPAKDIPVVNLRATRLGMLTPRGRGHVFGYRGSNGLGTALSHCCRFFYVLPIGCVAEKVYGRYRAER